MNTAMAATMTLRDAFSASAKRITASAKGLKNSIDEVSAASGRGVDTSGIERVGREASRATDDVEDLGDALSRAGRESDALGGSAGGGVMGLASKFKGAALAAGGIAIALKAAQAVIPALVSLSDQISSSDARLNFVVDDGGSVDALKDRLMAVATASRASYLDTANMFSRLASSAGDAFNNDNEEILAFTEQINKMFAIAGVGGQEASAAMTQLTQALGSGTLRGDELNSILEQAPIITQTIAKSLGVSTGEIRNLASEGKITAEVVKNAILGAADETNEAFNQMPLTWSQVTTKLKNVGLTALMPLLQGLSKIADFFGNHIQTIQQWGEQLSGMLSKVTSTIGQHGAMFAAIGTAIGKVITLVLSAASVLIDVWSRYAGTVMGGIEKIVSAVAGAANVAQVLVTSVYGTLKTAVASSWDSLKALGSNIKTLASQLKNALLYALYSVIAKLEEFSNKLKGLVGLSPDTSAYDSYISKAQQARNAMSSASYKSVGGTRWETDLTKSSLKQAYKEGSDLSRFMKSSTSDVSTSIDTSKYSNSSLSASGTDALADAATATAENTGRMASTISDLKDSISEITEMMERQIVNSFTSTQVNIDMSNMVNNLQSDVDLDGFLDDGVNKLIDVYNNGPEGGHY